MAPAALDDVAFLVLDEAPCAESDAVINLHMMTDAARLADDNAGAMVDEEVGADGRAGMHVDAGAAVCPFGHHARDDRGNGPVQNVRELLDGDGFDEGIRKNDPFPPQSRRIAPKGGLNVRTYQLPDLRQRAAKLVHYRRCAAGWLPWITLVDTPAHLTRQAPDEARHPFESQVGQRAMPQRVIVETGKEQLQQIFAYLSHHAGGGQVAMESAGPDEGADAPGREDVLPASGPRRK